MAEIVAGVACSHVPFLAMHPEFERAGVEQRKRVVAGFEAARQILEEADPDAIVVFSNDHFDRCFYDNLPAFLVGVGEEAAGPPYDTLAVPKARLRVMSELGRFIVEEGLERGVDFALSEDLPLDHAETVPMSYLTPRWDRAIVPIIVNAFAPPMPSLKRCYDVGAFVRGCVERWPANKRIAFLGTGGISHWVGPPETGRINPEFDRWFLERLVRREAAEVIEKYRSRAALECTAGNGGNEIRDWLAVAGAMPEHLRARVLAYEPVQEWVTGTGVMAWAAA
jgi:aromatic ring-opening dioxygenase catalytic subunit (LigB family)